MCFSSSDGKMKACGMDSCPYTAEIKRKCQGLRGESGEIVFQQIQNFCVAR